MISEVSDIILKLNKVKNQRGSAMVTVIIVIAVLVVLGTALLDSSMLGFKGIKHEQTTQLAYNAAQSGVEKCFAYIDRFCSKQSNTDAVPFTNNADFAQRVLDKIMGNLKTETNPSGTTVIYNISTTGSDIATVEIPPIKVLECKVKPSDASKLEVTIGVYARAGYVRTGDQVSNKTIFSKKKIEMFLPGGFKLNAAIYTVGDLMIDNINAKVTGDVVAFGTSPQFAKQVEQYYYGGIYAKNKGHLSVDGNAYSRGLIRTGEYYNFNIPPTTSGGSSIYIYKDAIANGLHIFGKGEKIVVGRNVYTFDDMEVNGEDSVIAVNGSFVGLSNPANAHFHDESSGIVNSAIVHHASSEDSLKSRVVVNGDVIIDGGTFKVDSISGVVDGTNPQIEDASVIAGSDYTPMYKEYQQSNSALSYHNWLFYMSSSYNPKGFANLIQRWTPRVFTDDASIYDWTTNSIDIARGIGGNDTTQYDNTDPSTISGYCHYEIGANDTIYYKDRGSNFLSKLNFINTNNVTGGQFMLDNIVTKPDEDDWAGFWDGLTGVSLDAWQNQDDVDKLTYDDPGDLQNVGNYGNPGKLKELKDYLRPLIEIFANRNYEWDSARNDDTKEPSIQNSLKGPPSGSTSGNLFLHMADKLDTGFSGSAWAGSVLTPDSYIFNFSSGTNNVPININDRLLARANYYYMAGAISSIENFCNNSTFLFINTNPTIDLIVNAREVNGTKIKDNGIIFSSGRVIIEKGTEVNGSIIAAGRGSTDSGSFVSDNSSADDCLPVIYKGVINNLSKLNDGSYAGVYFKGVGEPGAVGVPDATVHFPGKDTLFDFFDAEGINIRTIFEF